MNSKSPKRSNKAQQIAQAALTEFTLNGFSLTSLEKIASSAGIGKSTIYEYYENKEELFIAAVRQACEQWFNQIKQICDQTIDPIERLEVIAEQFIDCDDFPAGTTQRFFFEVLMQTIKEGGAFYNRRHEIQHIHQKFIRTLSDILLAGVSKGQLNPKIARDADKIAITFLAFMDGMVLQSLVESNYIDVKAQIAFFIEHLAPILLKQETQITYGSEHNCNLNN
ncbi:MAG: TetR/AcrR family transcriptional regulator [Desulfobacteraceae bacterium]|nr:TetR/AcrR family transcriptional regulator [Desulfobacteraceae bacterium]